MTIRTTATDVRRTLKEGMARLRAARIPSHTLAAELLLMHALGRDRTWLYSHPESSIPRDIAEKYLALIERRASGEPTQYLTGKQEFWGLEFEVNRDVLIPRPETEHLIEVALERLGSRGLKINAAGAANSPLRVADVGTGSGCIAVALAREMPHAEIVAIDISEAALAVARRNATRHGVADQIQFIQSDFLVSCREFAPFDLIVSNPPYVDRDEAENLPREVRDHEPHVALFGGAMGTEMYPRLVAQAFQLLRAGGTLVLELGHNSAGRIRQLLVPQKGWDGTHITNDLAGIARVIAAQRLAFH